MEEALDLSSDSMLNNNNGGECLASDPDVLLPQKESPRYLLNITLGEPHSRSGPFGVIKMLVPAGNSNTIPQSFSP